MKKLYPTLTISLLFISVGLSQKEYNVNDLKLMDNGLYTIKFSEEPITGKVYGYFGVTVPKKKLYIVNIINGKREGKEVHYHHTTGKKEYENYYKDGKLDGVWTEWYENGQKEYVGFYKDGYKHGIFTFWYNNGQKEEEYTYKDGKLDGLFTLWWPNGLKKEECTFKDGELVEIIGNWNEDGSVKE